jgi:hypothetical protein
MSGGAFPYGVRVSRRMVCVRPSWSPLATVGLRSESETVVRMTTAVRAAMPLYPRGPRFGPGCVVLVHPRLSAPSAPLAGTSRLRRRATYTRCPRCAVASATHEWFRAFAARSFSTCRPLRPRGARRRLMPICVTDDTGLRAFRTRSALPTPPPSVSSGLPNFGASPVHSLATACRVASLLDGSDRVSPAAETFTSGLPTCRSPFPLPDMTTVAFGHSPPAGLSPAGTAASFAAP